MDKPGIILKRYAYEDFINVNIEASNGRVCGQVEFYCSVGNLNEIGKKLADFSGGRAESIVYELGSAAQRYAERHLIQRPPQRRGARFIRAMVSRWSGCDPSAGAVVLVVQRQ